MPQGEGLFNSCKHSLAIANVGPATRPWQHGPMPRRQVQCSTGPFWTMSLARALDLVAEAGFVEVELMVTRDPATQEPDLPRRLADDRGLRIASVHGPFLVITKSVWGMDPLGKIRRGVEFCRAVGASSLIVHPPYLWEGEYARWVREECDAFCAEHGVEVVVETMYPKWVAGRRMRAYRWLEPAALVDAAPYVAIDTSHLTVSRVDILDALDTLLPKLSHIHLSNNNGDGRDGHLEVDRGILPLDRFLDSLRRARYRGAVSLELSVRRYLDRHDDLVAMLRRNREFVERHLSAPRRAEKGMPRRGRGDVSSKT